MPEKPSSTQSEPISPAPKNTSEPTPKKGGKKRGGWFQKIPPEVLFSPGGIILIIFAFMMEALDPLIPGGSLTVEMIPEILFMILLRIVAKVPLKSMIIPFGIERIPVISDIVPTWLIRMFM